MFKFTLSFGEDKNKDTKENKVSKENTVFSCKGDTCTYSQDPNNHHDDPGLKGGYVGDTFQLEWEI